MSLVINIDLSFKPNSYVVSNEIKKQLKGKIYPWQNLTTTNTTLGEGFFGIVLKAELKRDGKVIRPVAVKAVKYKRKQTYLLCFTFNLFIIYLNLINLIGASHVEYDRLLKEARAMVAFKHPNVMPLIGVVLGPYEEVPHLILPFMENGSLLDYLETKGTEIAVHKLLEFCLQIAQGLEYLASKNFVHADLAIRNFLLDNKYNIVIADYGLTKVTDVNGYYL